MINWNWPVVGHQKIVKFLQNCSQKERLSHAYLFYGPENLGKKTVAKYFALSLICQKEKKPCLECENCKEFLKDIYPNAVWIRKKENEENEVDEANEGKERGRKKKIKNISIDQIRNLKTQLSLSSFSKSYKIVIIVNAEDLSQEAADSFLKILEEPPQRRIIILIANQASFLPKTILSRCQLMKFSFVAREEIEDFLRQDHRLSAKEAKEMASLSVGRPGRAIKLISSKQKQNDLKENLEKFLKIIESDLTRKFKMINEILGQKKEVGQEMIFNWMTILRDLLLVKIGADFLIINLFLKDKLRKIAKKYSLNELYFLIKEINKLKSYFYTNVNARLALENFILNL